MRSSWIKAHVLGTPVMRYALVILALASQPVRAQEESLREALCRLVETAAADEKLPIGFFTRLIFKESAFRPHVVSPKGAQGVAQFMPDTAAQQGLADPFDPEQAIPASAKLLSQLRARFGNLGLAAAAYNGGPMRVENFRQGRGDLATETQDYVAAITGAAAEDWRAGKSDDDLSAEHEAKCVTLVAQLGRGAGGRSLASAALAPWGVQLAGNFSRSLALSAYARAALRLRNVIGERAPMIIGTRLRFRGARPFYRVRVPAQTRQAADDLCSRIRARGGACIVLKS